MSLPLPPPRVRARRPSESGAELEERIHAALSRALLEGRLTPGAKLPEHRLARIFGVSRERIRKILHRLVAERRLEAIPQRGVFVPNPSPQEIHTIYEAHRVFEAGVLGQLVRLDDGSIHDPIAAHLDLERDAAVREDRPECVRLSGEFHIMLVDALGNSELSRFIRELIARSSLMVAAFEPARLSLCGVDEHAAIAAALRGGDVEQAIRMSAEHFGHIEERLAQGLIERSERPLEAVLAALTSLEKRKAERAPASAPAPASAAKAES